MGWHGDKADAGWRVLARASVVVSGCLVLANCSSSTSKLTNRLDPRYGVAASPRVVEPGQPVPKGGGVYRVGKPYLVGGRMYTPEENGSYRAEGLASWYGDDFHGRLTANGEIYDMGAISAAHPTLPMPSYVRVTNLSSRKSLIVRVNDRGPYHANREIDLSAKAADLLGFRGHGVARVRVEYVGPAPIEGTDDRVLMATLRDGAPAPAPPTTMLASNRFLPNFGRAPIRSSVPMPQERPYDLGDGNDRVALAYPQQRSAAFERREADTEMFAERPVAPRAPRIADVSPDTEPPAYMIKAARAIEAQRARETSANARVETSANTRVAATMGPQAPAIPPGWNVGPPPASPVTAYAPARYDGSAVSTGRGLY